MALHFYKIAVKKIDRLTADAVCVTFDITENLKKQFTFTHGQNITIKKIINGQEIRRSYSICSSPLDNEIRVGIKKTTGGLFSTYANSKLQPGELLDILPPTGNFFTPLNSLHQKNYVAFAAGSGITPILSIIKTTLATEPKSNFTLFFGNRNHGSIMFKEELEGLKNKYLTRFSLHNILSRERTDSDINYGRIDENKCIRLAKLFSLQTVDEFFICGPTEMVFTIKKFLEERGIAKSKIHFELFATPSQQKEKNKQKIIPVIEEDNTSKITVRLDGRSFDFNLHANSNTILDAALAQGADLPFSCKGGVCTTCKAKLLQGKVTMEVNYGLEDDEVEAGFILTCQSHPASKFVVVDYDCK